jgi:hypothetical protein
MGMDGYRHFSAIPVSYWKGWYFANPDMLSPRIHQHLHAFATPQQNSAAAERSFFQSLSPYMNSFRSIDTQNAGHEKALSISEYGSLHIHPQKEMSFSKSLLDLGCSVDVKFTE